MILKGKRMTIVEILKIFICLEIGGAVLHFLYVNLMKMNDFRRWKMKQLNLTVKEFAYHYIPTFVRVRIVKKKYNNF